MKLTYCYSDSLLAMTRGTSISLGDPHREKIEQIIEATYKSTGKHVSASVAVQIALLAFQLNSNLETLIVANESFDKRRKSNSQAEDRKSFS